MKCTQLCPEGHYEVWEPFRKMELDIGNFKAELGHRLLLANSNIRLWYIELEPEERLGFRRLEVNFKVISHSRGFAVSHRSNGEIVLIQFKKGDVYRYKLEEQGEQVWDLLNIGPDSLQFLVIEELYFEDQK